MQRGKMDAFETKEIRGISLKGLIALIGCTITICTTTVVSYSNLKSDIRTIQVEKGADEKINDQRIKIVETEVDAIRVNIESLRNEVYTNRRAIEKNK
jgi:hypothetical protein